MTYDFLVVSNVVLWIGFVLMILVNLALSRQIGILYERVAPAGALMLNSVLKVGDAAPELSVPALDGQMVEIGKQGSAFSQLIFFVSPDCPVCSSLIPAIRSAAKSEASWLRLVLASDGDNQDHAGYVRDKALEEYPYVVSEVLGRSCGVSKLPFAVLVDESGRVAALGMVNSREHLDSLFEAKDHNVASIQEYLSERQA